MSETEDKTVGRLRAFMNTEKTPGDNKPAFSGKLVLPGETHERQFVLWSRRDKRGDLILSGHAHPLSGSPMEQITGLSDASGAHDVPDQNVGDERTPLVLKARDIVLFENRHKGEKRPDFYGYHHSGQADRPAVRLSVWAKTDQNGRAYLTGNVRDRVPEQTQTPEPELDLEPVAQ